MGRLRIGDLGKLFGYRYGPNRTEYVFPDDDAGREDLAILLQHYYGGGNPLAVPRVIKRRAPWMDDDETVALINQIDAYPRKWRSDTLGRLLNVTRDDWLRDRYRTLAPVDMTKEERRENSKIRHKLRMRERRRLEGRMDRRAWLAKMAATKTLNRLQPWLDEIPPISRRTWFYRQKKIRAVVHNKIGAAL
jgi:hypothetical protein